MTTASAGGVERHVSAVLLPLQADAPTRATLPPCRCRGLEGLRAKGGHQFIICNRLLDQRLHGSAVQTVDDGGQVIIGGEHDAADLRVGRADGFEQFNRLAGSEIGRAHV